MVPDPVALPTARVESAQTRPLLVAELGHQAGPLEPPYGRILGGIDDDRVVRLPVDDEGYDAVLAARSAFQAAAGAIDRDGHVENLRRHL